MMRQAVVIVAAAMTVAAAARAQAPVPEAMPFDVPYGTPVGIEQAKQLAGAAVAEMKRHNWKMAVAVADPAGDLVYFEKADGTQIGSVRIAQEKARASAQFRRPTKAFGDAVASGTLAPLTLGIVAAEGGVPLVQDGKIVGAIGVSGGLASQDAVVAKAGADASK